MIVMLVITFGLTVLRLGTTKREIQPLIIYIPVVVAQRLVKRAYFNSGAIFRGLNFGLKL